MRLASFWEPARLETAHKEPRRAESLSLQRDISASHVLKKLSFALASRSLSSLH